MAVMKFAVGLAAGYVLGSRAGREKYEQIVSAARTTQQKFNGQSAPAAVSEPSVTESSVAEPVTAEPAVAKPVTAEPVVAETVVAEPVVTETPGAVTPDAESSPVAGSPVPRPARRRTKSTVTAPAVNADPLA